METPEQFITRVGHVIRAYSIDELPQVYDIFIGVEGIMETTEKSIDFSKVVAG